MLSFELRLVRLRIKLEYNIMAHKNKQDVYLIENMECLNPTVTEAFMRLYERGAITQIIEDAKSH